MTVYEVEKKLISEEDRQQALATVDALCQPAPEAFIIAELGKLRLMTASRDAGQDLGLLFAVYADALREYPADLIREVLTERGRTERWWPSVAEVIEPLKRMMRPRRALQEALCLGYREPEVSPDWIPPNATEKAAVVELLTENDIPTSGYRHERVLEHEPLTPAAKAKLQQELAAFRLLPEDDPGVQARLRELEAR